MTVVAVITPAVHTRSSLRATLAHAVAQESRQFAARHLDVDLCEHLLGGAGFCMMPDAHSGSCLPIPTDYDPRPVTV